MTEPTDSLHRKFSEKPDAEVLLRHEVGDQFDVVSAGVEPTKVRPLAIAAMTEAGIDISGQRSKSVAEFAGQEFDYVITCVTTQINSVQRFGARLGADGWRIRGTLLLCH